MSLNRFTNISDIITNDGPLLASTWRTEHISVLSPIATSLTPGPVGFGLPYLQGTDITVEAHVYAPSTNSLTVTGDTRIIGGPVQDFVITGNELMINYTEVMKNFGITRGNFEVIINIYRNIIGDYSSRPLIVKEISPDRRELHLKIRPGSFIYPIDIENYLNSYGTPAYQQNVYQTAIDPITNQQYVEVDAFGNPIILEYNNIPLSDAHTFLNLGDNELYRIVNVKPWVEGDDLVVRLYQPLPESFNENDSFACIVDQLSDSYSDNVIVRNTPEPEIYNELAGPNFESFTVGTTTETDFKNYNQLLTATPAIAQQVVDSIFSGSLGTGTKIPIDYSGFQNFVFYSSAEQRVRNFKHKLEYIELYNDTIGQLNAANTDAAYMANNITVNEKLRDRIVSSFDGYERWLYYEQTSSLFTNQPSIYEEKDPFVVEGGLIGAENYRIPPYPKFLSNGQFVRHHTTSSIATDWFNSTIASASLFDVENDNALLNTIPEFVRTDPNNDQYLLFTNMIGHHFDILYAYVNNLSNLYKHEEHPKLGQDPRIYVELAESLGWYLQDGNQSTSLVQYTLGVDSGSGAYAQTGSLFSKSNKDLTTEIWQRMYNNLPYILKTKGTKRAIHAIMNIYGIPQTLLSIREYGGPKVGEDEPVLIEDRFGYALKVNQGAHLKINNEYVSSSYGLFGVGLDKGEVPVIKREFRIKPRSGSSIIYSRVERDASGAEFPTAHIAIERTGSYSGSNQYGRINYAIAKGTSAVGAITASTEYLPLFDGDVWNVTEFYVTTGDHFNTGSNTDTSYNIKVQKASDYIVGKIIHSGSITISPTYSDHYEAWSLSPAMEAAGSSSFSYLGGNTGSSDRFNINSELTNLMGPLNLYTGSVQEYREWIEDFSQKSFDIHTLNPSSYVSSLSATGSFDTLVKHYPLGTDLKAVDRSQGAGLFVTSSHPDQKNKDYSPSFTDGRNTYATASGFITPDNPLRGNYEVIEETYYVQGVSLGGSVPRSQKIRLEENELITTLTPDRSAEKSRFDRAPLDSNRLGLFYSLADQINKDIFNHVGDVALDDFVGDPDHEFTEGYPDLFHFSKQYWKKFDQRNDLNAFIRVFTQFDFSIFTQIQQTIPERVDDVTGLLIEPHALERSKVRITSLPEVEDLALETELHITSSLFPTSDVIPEREGIIDKPYVVESETLYHLTDNGILDIGNRFGTIPMIPTGAADYCTIAVYPVDEKLSVTASIQSIYTVQNNSVSSPWTSLSSMNAFDSVSASADTINSDTGSTDSIRLQLKTYNMFDTVRDFTVNISHKNEAGSGEKLFVLDSAIMTVFDDEVNSDHPNYKNNLTGQQLGFYDGTRYRVRRSGSFVGTPIQEKKVTGDYINTDTRSDAIVFKNVKVNAFTDLTIDIKLSVTGSYSIDPRINKIDVVQSISEVCHSPLQQIVDKCRPSTIYSRKVYHFGSQQATFSDKYKRDADRYTSQSLGLYYSQSLETACYMDDFFAIEELQRYEGMKNIGTAVNGVPSPGGFSIVGIGNFTGTGAAGSPVEIFIVNPNQMIYNPTAPTATTAAGNIVVSGGGTTRPTPVYGPPRPGNTGPQRANPGQSNTTGQNTGYGG